MTDGLLIIQSSCRGRRRLSWARDTCSRIYAVTRRSSLLERACQCLLVVLAGMALIPAWAACDSGQGPDVPQPRESIPSAENTPGESPGPDASPIPSPEAEVRVAPSPSPPPAPAPLSELDIEEAFPNLSFPEMVYMTYADDDSNRLFVVLKPGVIMVFPNERHVSSAAWFLDIRGRVRGTGSEEGLLGLAFGPDYRVNGNFYVYYSASNPRRSVVSRFSVSATNPNLADDTSEQIILEVRQPFPNHNGGQILFGPDGYLYIGLGDGGSGGDPDRNGQNLSTFLGTILRLDVTGAPPDGAYAVPADNPFVGRGGGTREEIWAYGLRNPWRFSFDRGTSVLWTADVGQNRFEEIDIIEPGLNYGWNIMEGFHCFFRPGRSGCEQEGLTLPIFEYDHSEGCSVTGGYVYRASRISALQGVYVYGDFCSGKIWGLHYDGASVTAHTEIADTRIYISSFAEDQAGEIYILNFDASGGKIYRFASAQ